MAPKNSDPHFAAIEITASQVDKLFERFDNLDEQIKKIIKVSEITNKDVLNTNKNVLILKTTQDEFELQQKNTNLLLNSIQGQQEAILTKIESIEESLNEIRQNIGGVQSLAKSAYDLGEIKLKKISGH